MNDLKRKALETVGRLASEGRIDGGDFDILRDALCDIESLQDRDEDLRKLWVQFGGVPIDPETDTLEDRFSHWETGVSREEIWHWFDQRHSKGIIYLLYNTSAEQDKTKTLMLWKNDFIRERDWNVLCDILGIKKEDTEVELRCVVCAHREYSRGGAKSATFECESIDCCFCCDGECRYALVYGEKPKITEEQGCKGYNPFSYSEKQ